MSIVRDYSGSKYGHLTLLRYAKPGGSGRGAIWDARCDCGNVKQVVAKDVANGRIKTCGICEYHSRLREPNPAGYIAVNKAQKLIYAKLVKESVRRGNTWQLSLEEVMDITGKSCVYCGDKPSQKIKNSKLVYSELDRLDPMVGYTLTNVVPCCYTCKQMKSGRNYQKFLDKVVKIYQHIFNSKTVT